jgi:hypothetical protein
MTEEFFNVKTAAAYCGYNDKYFGKLSAKFKIPRHGPKRNKFKRSELDLFMREPEAFIRVHQETRTGYRKVTL